MTEAPKDGARKTLTRIGTLLDKHDVETAKRIVSTLSVFYGVLSLKDAFPPKAGD
jgi:hypothetical protein